LQVVREHYLRDDIWWVSGGRTAAGRHCTDWQLLLQQPAADSRTHPHAHTPPSPAPHNVSCCTLTHPHTGVGRP
jgi:hypothetical protein